MTSPRVTDWYPGDVKPVREGVYQRQYFAGVRFCFWDGASWYLNADTVKEARKYKYHRSFTQQLPWRGLAEQPSGAIE